MMRRLAGPVALLAGLAFLAVNGSAAYRTSHYTYNDSTCHKRSDPVNLILSGPNATAGYVGDRVYLVTGWNSHSGSTQRFLTGGKCSKMDGHLASGTFGRYHVRWNASRAATGAASPASAPTRTTRTGPVRCRRSTRWTRAASTPPITTRPTRAAASTRAGAS